MESLVPGPFQQVGGLGVCSLVPFGGFSGPRSLPGEGICFCSLIPSRGWVSAPQSLLLGGAWGGVPQSGPLYPLPSSLAWTGCPHPTPPAWIGYAVGGMSLTAFCSMKI